MWMVSDEAYRELYYEEGKDLVSVWSLNDSEVPGIEGRRISIETASKVWNACGLRIGAVITDNELFNNRSVAEYTANLLCQCYWPICIWCISSRNSRSNSRLDKRS